MPVLVMGHADGAVVALAAVESGVKVDGLILTSPWLALGDAAGPLPGLDRAAAPGWKPWSREGRDDLAKGHTHDAWRGKVGHAWQTANPDLRMSGSSRGWQAAHRAASRDAHDRAAAARAPILMLNADNDAQSLCQRASDCRQIALPGARRAVHLEADRWRAPWRASVIDFVEQVTEAKRKSLQ